MSGMSIDFLRLEVFNNALGLFPKRPNLVVFRIFAEEIFLQAIQMVKCLLCLLKVPVLA